jgi:hypothetical protein
MSVENLAERRKKALRDVKILCGLQPGLQVLIREDLIRPEEDRDISSSIELIACHDGTRSSLLPHANDAARFFKEYGIEARVVNDPEKDHGIHVLVDIAQPGFNSHMQSMMRSSQREFVENIARSVDQAIPRHFGKKAALDPEQASDTLAALIGAMNGLARQFKVEKSVEAKLRTQKVREAGR